MALQALSAWGDGLIEAPHVGVEHLDARGVLGMGGPDEDKRCGKEQRGGAHGVRDRRGPCQGAAGAKIGGAQLRLTPGSFRMWR